MPLRPNLQKLADVLAANFTAVELGMVARAMGEDLAELEAGSRQEMAEKMVQGANDNRRLPQLLEMMARLHPEEMPTMRKGFELDEGIIFGDGFGVDENGGVLSGDGGRTHRPRVGAVERVVSTGFAEEDDAAVPYDKRFPLDPETEYYFWLQVGAPVEGAIDTEAVALDTSDLPDEARLQVVLFGFSGGLILREGQTVGELVVRGDGTVRVARRVATPEDVPDALLAERLYFPIATPAGAGTYELRCNIYYEQILLQSRLVTAEVSLEAVAREGALTAVVDYVIAKSLNPAHLAQMRPHRLSVMLNSNGAGTHGFRFFGMESFKNEVELEAGALQDLIDQARGALRRAAWGKETKYSGEAYLYEGKTVDELLGSGKLATDLFICAFRGYRFYDVVINRLAGGNRAWRQLKRLMREPGDIQFASKRSAGLVLPTAMIYDYPLDTGVEDQSRYTLCPTFVQALRDGTPLLETPCFQGNCPSYGDDTVICPSGFWGFRHNIGMPVSIPHAPELPVTLPVGDAPTVAMAVSQDFGVHRQHRDVLRGLAPNLGFHYAEERPETIEMMQKVSPHVLYFFCHGRVFRNVPSIEVGPRHTIGITRDNLRSKDIFWEDVRPLVFINGCHTTALEPETAIDLVSGFLDVAEAAGVIGTEITNFVSLARPFAEGCLRRFVVERQSIGQAIRESRLDLLQTGNPLGLMYVPYVMSSLRLERFS